MVESMIDKNVVVIDSLIIIKGDTAYHQVKFTRKINRQYSYSCWVGSALSFPVGGCSNSKKEAPIGVPGTSIRSVRVKG